MEGLREETSAAHRDAVVGRILGACTRLIEERGLAAVTMSALAEASGVGRATLYRYFPDLRALLQTWHERYVEQHLQQLALAAEAETADVEGLRRVLLRLANSRRGHAAQDVVHLLHADIPDAEGRVSEVLRPMLRRAARAGAIRSDPSPAALTDFCVRALSGVEDSDLKPAVDLVMSALTGSRQERSVGR